MKIKFHGIHPDSLGGRKALMNPERGFRTEIYAGALPGEIAGTCSCHSKQLKLDGRDLKPRYVNRLIRGNRLDAIEFCDAQWADELDYFAYDGITVMQTYVYLSNFSEKEEISNEKLNAIDLFFNNVRKRRVKTLFRFAYELRPRTIGPSAEIIFSHLEQLKDLLLKHIDVIYAFELGCVGIFGEWHDSLHHLESDIEFRKKLFDKVLEILPPERAAMVRYPHLKIEIYGKKPLQKKHAWSMDPRARIGHFHDGMMAHAHPFPDSPEYGLITDESRYLPIDGELFWSDLSGQKQPEEAVLMLKKHHYDTMGFVHSHSLFEQDEFSMDLWKNIPADPAWLMENNLPISDGYFRGEDGRVILRSYYEYIRDHIGYRFELQNAEFPEEITAGKDFKGSFTINNRGFSTPWNRRFPELVFRKGQEEFVFSIDSDPRKWYSDNVDGTLHAPHKISFSCKLNGKMKKGIWKVGIRLPDASPSLHDIPEYCIRFANDIDYINGINILGECHVL